MINVATLLNEFFPLFSPLSLPVCLLPSLFFFFFYPLSAKGKQEADNELTKKYLFVFFSRINSPRPAGTLIRAAGVLINGGLAAGWLRLRLCGTPLSPWTGGAEARTGGLAGQ